jgi:hypothetical protein
MKLVIMMGGREREGGAVLEASQVASGSKHGPSSTLVQARVGCWETMVRKGGGQLALSRSHFLVLSCREDDCCLRPVPCCSLWP